MYRLIEFDEDPHPYNLIVSRYVILSYALIDGALPLCRAWQGVFYVYNIMHPDDDDVWI
jgi:hypothetical protein